MTEFRCNECDRNFGSQEALDSHNAAKHSSSNSTPTKKSINYKKFRNWGIFFLILGLALYGIVGLINNTGNVVNVDEDKLDFNAPSEEIHWHPSLEIIINGEKQKIPENVGITNSAHFPIHTHEDADSGVLHMENSDPTKKTVTLGYFFEVWGKTFNETCIFDYCTSNDSESELKMFVNGKENSEFQNYFMQEGDNIRIEYNSD